MSKPSKIVTWGMALLVALLATGLSYAEQSVYADTAFGRAKVDNDAFGIAVADDTNAVRAGIGFDFGNNISIEGSYVSLGDIEDGSDLSLVKGETDGFTAAARFEMPLTETFSASARAGAFFWESKFESPTGTFSEEGEDLFYGVSLDFEATSNLTLTGTWDRFAFDDGDADVLWAGLRYKF